jgi:hypothetical protein
MTVRLHHHRIRRVANGIGLLLAAIGALFGILRNG